MPYAMRWILHLSHPGLSPRALRRVLEPRPGERMLEIGPGIGTRFSYFTRLEVSADPPTNRA